MLFRVIRITMAMTLLLSAMTSWVCAAPLSGASGLPCPESEHSVTWTSSLNTQTCSMSPFAATKGNCICCRTFPQSGLPGPNRSKARSARLYHRISIRIRLPRSDSAPRLWIFLLPMRLPILSKIAVGSAEAFFSSESLI